MSKREVIWLLIRLTGVYLIGQAFFSTITYLLVFYGWGISATLSGKTPGSSGLGTFGLQLNELRIPMALGIIVPAVVGLYLTRGGRLIFKILNYEGKEDSRD